MDAVELFTGAGGLALGTANAGFHHRALVEFNHAACNSIRLNQQAGHAVLRRFPLHETDVRDFDYSQHRNVALVAGGPPCQPFSIGGKHRGYSDTRDMFPEAVRAVRELAPQAFVFENVKGLRRQSFASYFEYILLQLQYPEICRRAHEEWQGHLRRLEKHHTCGSTNGLRYNVVFQVLNAADFGVPQKRERVFIVGFRSDLGVAWSFPKPTHSGAALLRAKLDGDYWDRHRVARADRAAMDEQEVRAAKSFSGDRLPWQTVRDAIADLPDPQACRGAGSCPANHVFIPGARSYCGHTGSAYDEPAKTLKAGAHGVPGGENMLLKPDGGVRYFTVREAARLQTFPDDYIFSESWTETMRQLGNAVPVRLAEAVAKGVSKLIIAKGAA